MKAVLSGLILSVHTGKSKAGKDYSVADLYDGSELIKVFGVDPGLPLGECTLPVRITYEEEKHAFFVVAIK